MFRDYPLCDFVALVRRHRHEQLSMCYVGTIIFFFFQAEDGIRDSRVTGVKTCALPISYAVFCLRKKDDTNELKSQFNLVGRLLVEEQRATALVPPKIHIIQPASISLPNNTQRRLTQ